MMCALTYAHVINALHSNKPQERTKMQLILVSYPLELIHLDFFTLGGRAEDNKGVNSLIVMDHFTKYAHI